MPPLGHRHVRVLKVAVDHRQTTTRHASAALGVTRSAAGEALRALERAGFVRGELVGGGELGYSATAAGRAWLEQDGADIAGT
jgi:predicted ArsR family transcriptional regulator